MMNSACVDTEDENQAQESQIIICCEKYLLNKSLTKDEKTLLRPFLSALGRVQEVRKTIKSAKLELQSDNTKRSLKLLLGSLSKLREYIQLIGSELEDEQFRIFSRILASEYCKIDFLYAFIMIGLNKLKVSIEALNETVTFATFAELSETVLSVNYLKSLVYVFNGKYKSAIRQYRFTFLLAKNYKNQPLMIKCQLGEAISLFMQGKREKSMKRIEYLTRSAEKNKNFADYLVAMGEMADFFYALGLPEIAYPLYSEALQLAVDTKGFGWKVKSLVQNMKRANAASAIMGYAPRPSTEISVMLDKAYNLKNVEDYNEAITEIANFNQLFYKPFEHYTQIIADKKQREKDAKSSNPLLHTDPEIKWKSTWTPFTEIHESLKDTFTCLKFQEIYQNKRTLIIVYSDLGILAFDVRLKEKIEGNPENYSVRLNAHARVKIERPDVILREMFLLRAVIKVEKAAHIKIIRGIPIFFSQMQI